MKRYKYSAYLYILPAFLIILVFRLYPMIIALVGSLFDWDIVANSRVFIGLKNYVNMLGEMDMWQALLQTFYFAFGVIFVGISVSVVIAVLMNQKIRAVGFYRTGYFIPFITALNAVAIVWLLILKPEGLLNKLLGIFGVEPIDYLNNPYTAMPAIILMTAWRGIGYNVIIILTRLQNIDEGLYQAATIDGANSVQKFFNITLPLLKPTLLFLIIMSTIGSFQAFSQFYIMTPNGGPLKSTEVMVTYLYRVGFVEFRMGYACAIAYFMFAILMLITFLQKKLLKPSF